MNKFLPQTGGHNLHLDEFLLMQDSYFEGFKAIIKKLVPTGNAILDGIAIDNSGGFIVNTSGYIAIAGEVFKVESQGALVSSGDATLLYFKPIQTAIQPPSPILYKDTISKNAHFSRKAVLKYKETSDSDGVLVRDLIGISSVLEGSIMPWTVPIGKVITDFFDNSGKGIFSAINYAICNGLNGTIDLRGLITGMATSVPSNGALPIESIVGQLSNNYLSLGGSNKFALTKENLPAYQLTVNEVAHSHTGFAREANTQGGSRPFALGLGGTQGTVTTNATLTGITVSSDGSDTPFELRQATKYLYYIQRIK